jgi:hypothetical protein
VQKGIQQPLLPLRVQLQLHGAGREHERILRDREEVHIAAGDRPQPGVLELACSPKLRQRSPFAWKA